MPETARVTSTIGKWGAYVRGLLAEAGSAAETAHAASYYRAQGDTAHVQGTVFRGLLIFVKILTVSLIRDFLLRRFLRSNEDLVLKSAVCRELEIESPL
jgi:hypothetical protein